MSEHQKTISKPVSYSGRGLFWGEQVNMTFLPAEPGTGIAFVREQDGKVATIPALVENIQKRPRRTCLKNGTLMVETVEHCMAALAGMGIDNAMVRVTGGNVGEVPAGDGSSQRPVHGFTSGSRHAGTGRQCSTLSDSQARASDPRRRSLVALPGSEDRLDILYEFEGVATLDRQVMSFSVGPGTVPEFLKQIAPARTFILESEVTEMRNRGMGKHLTQQRPSGHLPHGPIDNAVSLPR